MGEKKSCELGAIVATGLGDRDVEFSGIGGALIIGVTADGRAHFHCSITPESIPHLLEVVLERYVRPGIRASLRASEAESLAGRIVTARSVLGPNGQMPT